MSYVKTFFDILSGQRYVATQRQVGPLTARRKTIGIYDAEAEVTVNTYVCEMHTSNMYPYVMALSASMATTVAISDLCGNLYLRHESAYQIFPGSIYSTREEFDKYMAANLIKMGTITYNDDEWHYYKFKRSVVLDYYGFKSPETDSFNQFLRTRYGTVGEAKVADVETL